MNKSTRKPPADAVWTWEPEGGFKAITPILIVTAAALVLGAAAGGAQGVLVAIGLRAITFVPLMLIGVVVAQRTWAALTPDGELTYRRGKRMTRLDLRKQRQVYAVAITHLRTTRSETGPELSSTNYVRVGNGPPPTRNGELDVLSLSASHLGPSALFLPIETRDDLVEAIRPFAEIVTVAGRVEESDRFGKVTIDYYPDAKVTKG